MKRIGYVISAGGKTKTTILDEVYPDGEAESAVRAANNVENGPNIRGLATPSHATWLTFPTEELGEME